MSLLDIFKKKRKGTKKEERPKIAERKEKKEEIKIEPAKQKKNTPGRAYRILYRPHITEKATDLSEKGKYVFRVWSGANKTEIKKTIEDKYGVDVLNVRTIRIAKKARKVGKHKGWRKGYKKAIVKLRSGQKIEILPR